MYPVIIIALLLMAIAAFSAAASEEATKTDRKNYTIICVISMFSVVAVNLIEHVF